MHDAEGAASNSLAGLTTSLLDGRPLIVASNRGPVQYALDEDGRLVAQRGAGGVVTALSAIRDYVPLTWISCALTDGDRRWAEAEGGADSAENLAVRFVTVPSAAFQKYYSTIANPLLWFLQHYMWDPAYRPEIDKTIYDAWENGYLPVNAAFAQLIVREAARQAGWPVVMLHDYHLYPLGGMVRRRLGRAILQHFVHIPWPDPDYWHLLPSPMRRTIFTGLLANDVIGFQTHRAVQNFLHGCRLFLGREVAVDWSRASVEFEGQVTRVRTYPISVDVARLRQVMETRGARRHIARLRQLAGELTIVRVDRAEPSKNIIRGFRAFDILLRRHREFHGRLKFLAFLVPTRTSVPEYRQYVGEIMQTIEAINQRHGTPEWKPIELFYEHNYVQALAGMSLYDVLLVNPIIDGMNLVAKEGPIVNTCDGVLVLSEGAGAFEQLRDGALAVAPADIEGTARALYQALKMSPGERARRAALLRTVIEQNDVVWWLERQLADLLAVRREREAALPRPEAAFRDLLEAAV